MELYIDHQFAPSCQAVIDTRGEITILSTHEQVLDGHVYQGKPPPATSITSTAAAAATNPGQEPLLSPGLGPSTTCPGHN